MTDVKLDNIFVMPIIDQPLNRAALEASIYLYCIEHGLRSASYNEYIVLHLKKDFFATFMCILFCSIILLEKDLKTLLFEIGIC